MKKRKKPVSRAGLWAAGAVLGIAGSWAGAMEWPVQNPRLINNFGWNDRGGPVLGITFESEGYVEAADPGEVIFIQHGFSSASRIPGPLGSWIALEHGEGLIGIYSRFDQQNTLEVPNVVSQHTPIGMAGCSGWSDTQGFYFSLFDRKERRWVNPAMIISPLPDTRAPVILSVSLRNSEQRTIDPSQTRSLGQGKYTVSVAAADTMLNPNERPLAPYRIICMVNGAEIGSLTFETYSARDGSLMIYRNGLVPVKQVYSPAPGFEIGDVWFTRGQATLEIIAQDKNENSQSVKYQLIVD
jgi:hypothetical protein